MPRKKKLSDEELAIQERVNRRMAETCTFMLRYVSEEKHFPRTKEFDAVEIQLREQEYWLARIEHYEAV